MRLTVYFPEDSPTTHEFVENKLTVGRLGDNDVQLDEGSVTVRHAEIVVDENGATLYDLGSTNGTFLNGVQVTDPVPVSDGDEIYFGNVRAVFAESAPQPSAEAVVEEVAVASAGEVSVPPGRPANFSYMSPFPKQAPPKDTLSIAAWAFLAIAIVGATVVLFTAIG